MAYNKETGMYEGFLYCLTNSINNKKYIGQTVATIQKRYNQHLTESRRETPRWAIQKAIKKYGKENFSLTELLKIEAEDLDKLKKMLNDLEIYFIQFYHSMVDDYGYNIDKGGNYNSVGMITIDIYDICGNFIEQLESVSTVAKKYQTCYQTIVGICNGNIPNYNNKYVFRYKGDHFEKFSSESNLYYDLYQFDINGILIGKYNNMNDAHNKTGVSLHKYIIDNPNLLAGGYWWSYTNKFNYKGQIGVLQKVDLYSLNGILIKTYNSITECAVDICANNSNVSAVCRGVKKTINGYVCRYHGESFDKYDYIPRHTYNKKPINQYTKENIFVMTYESATQASLMFTDKGSSAICACCNKSYGRYTAYGYKWFYANDTDQPDKTKIISYTN